MLSLEQIPYVCRHCLITSGRFFMVMELPDSGIEALKDCEVELCPCSLLSCQKGIVEYKGEIIGLFEDGVFRGINKIISKRSLAAAA